MHNFQLINLDTDSVMISDNGRELSKEERKFLLDELNSLYPETIHWEDDGYYPSVVVLKAKNYVLKSEDEKVKIKGSALKATNKEPALKEYINSLISLLLKGEKDLIPLYNSYIKEILNVQDISRWSVKKTITESVLNPERLNEQKVFNMLTGDEQEGDKIYCYYDINENLCLSKNWTNNHHVPRLLKKLYDTTKIFTNVLDIKQFINYSLKTKQKLLEIL